jgi:hypothetical protein
VMIIGGLMLHVTWTYGQSLLSPRAVGMGAYAAVIDDIRGFAANPAGLTGIRDWDFSLVTYTPTSGSHRGFVFHGLVFGKRFLDDHAVALQYSPGTALEFTIPSSITVLEPNIPSTVDQTMSYSERFAFGYGVRLDDRIAVGATIRLRQEHVSDTQYELVITADTTFLRPERKSYEGRSWDTDVGMNWKFTENVTVSLLARSLAAIRDGGLPSEYAYLRLPHSRQIEAGVAFRPSPSLNVALEASTAKTGAVGCEWLPGYDLSIRSGVYFSKIESPFAYAVSAGIGWSFDFLSVDISYLRFLNQDRRAGTAALSAFNAGQITSIDLNPYTSDRAALSFRAIFGNVRESAVRIDGVEISETVFPAAFPLFAYRPLGTVRVKNVASRPVRVTASFFIDRLMDAPTESAPVAIMPGDTAEIPLHAVFNERIKTVQTLTVHDGLVSVSATPHQQFDDRTRTRVIVRGRNDWDGNVRTLRYFVTPDDPAVLRYTRDVFLEMRDSLAGVPGQMETFHRARLLLNTFARQLVYVNDPKLSADHVQYPSETLQLRGGDCDDMTVLFASLLGSIGISTAFVDVVPPDRPEESHIYLLFDTGLEPKFGSSIAENPKRYVVRRNERGVETIWIPVETTVIANGFDEAWATGAGEFYNDVEVSLGLIKGWVTIVDVN